MIKDVWDQPEANDMDRDEPLKLLKGGPERIAEWNRRRKLEEIPEVSSPKRGVASPPSACNGSFAL
jgi:hypothetical protein